ncbi:hypothetical protein F5882DRAFT_383597 [Hyaloscypha sp. PMI_1271]|nr:hypothetical protein F5882DRAFT_383597 [Hyaloscypha sp. PMI_1271]
MTGQSAFETLSTELFENIISQVNRPPDLNALCLVSRSIYQRVVPRLYHSWKYHGLQHSQKSLRPFLQTIIWRPDLAAHIRVLDVREWGDYPQLEYEQGCPWTDPFHGTTTQWTIKRRKGMKIGRVNFAITISKKRGGRTKTTRTRTVRAMNLTPLRSTQILMPKICQKTI